MVFNFDEWAQLAKKDKAAFEQKRITALKQAINDCAKTDAELRMLNGLQFKIDMLRRKHKTPMAACVALSTMLMDHAYRMVHPDTEAIISAAKVAAKDTESCKIIPFNRLRK